MTDVRTEKGYGFLTKSGKQFLVRCHECGKENYAPAVASGCCAWCGYDANATQQPSTSHKEASHDK